MDAKKKLMTKQGESFYDPERYRRLVGKLIYLTIATPDLSFVVDVVSQFMQTPFYWPLECYHSYLKIPQKSC